MADDNKTLELQIRIAAQEALKAVSSLKGEIQTLASEAQKFAGTDGAALNETIKDAEAAAKDTCSGFGDLKKAILSTAEAAAALKALSVVKDMGAFALQTADNFQTARNQFGILLGDMEAGAGLFNEIKAFNDKTPFDLSTLTQATNVLISAKVPLQDLQAQLTKFGDLSQGNSQKMTSYVNAFSQAAAKGKADMQVLNTYLHQGVPILDALAKNFGVTTAEIVTMSSEGKISFEDFSQALDDLTTAGGQYFGGMELASKSLAAMQEGLKEAVNSLAASFGEMLLPAATDVVGIFTDITNAINESPIAKGILAGAIVAVTGYMAAMAAKAVILAAKTWLAQAAQMGLNASLAVTNPLLIAGIAAAAAATVAYVAYAAKQQDATRSAEDFALAQRKQNDAVRDGAAAVQAYYRAAQNFDLAVVLNQMKELQEIVDEQRKKNYVSTDEMKNLRTATERFVQLRNEFIKEFYDATNDEKIKELRDNISVAQTFLVKVDISQEDKTKLERIIAQFQEKIDKILGDPNEEAAERRKMLKEINDEEERLLSSISKTKIDDLQYQMRKQIEAIDELEKRKIEAAIYTEEEIAEIRKRYEQMREDTRINLKIEIDTAKLDEARAAVKNWQQELSDSLLALLLEFKVFSIEAAVIISDLMTQFIELSATSALGGFEEFGRALGEGKKAAESLSQALAEMSQQILNQLPTMFLQAGLQLIAQGQWALGLGFIAAAGSTAIIAGYVDGKKSEASANAHGNVFDEYGKAARTFADGGAFTNQIVSSPTYFRHGAGLGLMGEAGPEAIMPLTRMPNGDLGIQTDGSGARVVVNIINNSGAEVRQEEHENADGGKQIDVIIGEMVNRHIASGKADRVMAGRYGTRVAGV